MACGYHAGHFWIMACGDMKQVTIGVFDSGIGGKLIAEQIKHALSGAKVIFQSDPEYFPYGNKPPDVISGRLRHFTRLFHTLKCQIVVIACNSATTNSIALLRDEFPDIQFVGVEPPVKPAVALTKSGKVAILGTPATISSRRWSTLQEKFSDRIEVLSIACPGLAEVIEECQQPGAETAELLRRFLDEPISRGVDVVGLACTHYAYLLSQMRRLFPGVMFYDPADAVVRRVKSLYNSCNVS